MNETNYLTKHNKKTEQKAIFEVQDDNSELPMMLSRQEPYTNRSKIDE